MPKCWLARDRLLEKDWMTKSKIGCMLFFQGMVVAKDAGLDLERAACYQHRVQCMYQLMEAEGGGGENVRDRNETVYA